MSRHSNTHGFTSIAALACGLLAATGGLRFDRAASLWTMLLASVLLYVLVGSRLDTPELLYSECAIAAIGGLNVWLTGHVRSAMEAERGRLLLRRFLPAVLIDSAFSDPLLALGAPRSVEATVLVSDVRGFTALSESLAPTAVLELLNELQGALAGAVEDSGGVVDKFMGDGMLAVFGVHEAQPDHARRGVQAALRIRAVMEAYNAQRPAAQRVKVGVGLHAGPLVAGLLGSGERLEFTVLGDTVNTASRVESLTKEHGVDLLLTGEVAASLGDTSLRALGEVTVRGRQQLLRLFTLDRTP